MSLSQDHTFLVAERRSTQHVSAMSSEAIIGLLLSFPIGLYGSVVISRYSRFSELRNEVLRIVRAIDFMQEGNKVNITNDQDIAKLPLIVSDLISLKHGEAAEVVSAIRSDIDDISMHAKVGRLDSSAFGQNFSNCSGLIYTDTPIGGSFTYGGNLDGQATQAI